MEVGADSARPMTREIRREDRDMEVGADSARPMERVMKREEPITSPTLEIGASSARPMEKRVMKRSTGFQPVAPGPKIKMAREMSIGGDSAKPMEMQKIITREAPMIGGIASALPPMKPELKIVRTTSGGGWGNLDDRLKKMVAEPTLNIGGNSARKEEDAVEKQKKKDEEEEEEGKIDESDAPLLSDKDARCYAGRYTDIGAANAQSHWAAVGLSEGRLGTCARDLTDFEAQAYLDAWPELQQKFGHTGKTSWEAARGHYESIGYTTKFGDVIKDVEDRAWKCGNAPATECKCQGTLYLGLLNRPDNKDEIKKWEDFRYFKTVSKTDHGFSLCNPTDFGSDPAEGQAKQCWCEDEPAYMPNFCGDDGEDCMCGGYVIYGQKLNKDKKANDFKDIINSSFTIEKVKEGLNALACSIDGFGGIDPFPDGEKACFCDNKMKMFDESTVKDIQLYWESEGTIISGNLQLKGTKTVQEEVEVEIRTKTEEWTQEIEVQETERKVALESIEASRKCIASARLEAVKFKQSELRRKYIERKRIVELRRQKLAQWKSQIEIKHSTTTETCSLSQRQKNPQEKQRLMEECTRLKEEVTSQTTEVNIETTKVDDSEKNDKEEENKEEGENEGKGDDDESEESTRTEINIATIEEETNETKETTMIEKVDITAKRLEILRIQEKTTILINNQLIKKRKLIRRLIRQAQQQINKINYEEEEYVDTDDDDDDVTTVTGKITTQQENRITKSTKIIYEYKMKVTYLVTQISTTTTKVVTLRKTVTELKTTIDTNTQMIIELTKTLRQKQDFLEKNPTVVTTVTMIEEIKEKIVKIEKLVKETRKEYITAYADSVSFQKLIDFYSTQKKEFQESITEEEEEIEESKLIIKEQEEKTKTQTTIKEVITVQEEAFESHQKETVVEEKISEIRVIQEQQVIKWRKIIIEETSNLEQTKLILTRYLEQIKTLEEQLKVTTDVTTKEEITKKITTISETITTTREIITKIEIKIKTTTTRITTVTTKYSIEITELTTELTKLIEETKTKDEKATKVIETLPGISTITTEKVTTTGGIIISGGSTSTSTSTTTSTTSKTTSTTKGTTTTSVTGTSEITSKVIEVTERAKKLRKLCTRATRNIEVRKNAIKDAIDDLKKENGDREKHLKDCTAKLKDLQENVRKTEGDMREPKNKAADRQSILAAKLKSVTQQFNTEQRACTKDEDDVAETNAQLMAKNKDLQASVSFVMRNCQEADAAEGEVGETINIVTQIEVVNRLYSSYFKQITEYNRQEKIYEQSRITFERESSRIISMISQYNSRIETATKTITTLKEKIKTITTSTTTTTTVITTQITKIKTLIKQQETIIETETIQKEKFESEKVKIEILFKEVTKLTTKIRRESKRAQQVFESSQKKLRIQVEASKKIENYRKRLTITHHTLSSKITTITKIIYQITKEITIIREKISSLNLEIDECTRAAGSARSLITTLTGKHTSIEQSIKTINQNVGASDKINLESELKKVESETETAKNTLTLQEKACENFKATITNLTSTIVTYEQEEKYYSTQLTYVRKEYEETQKTITTVITGSTTTSTKTTTEETTKEEKETTKEEKETTKEETTKEETTKEETSKKIHKKHTHKKKTKKTTTSTVVEQIETRKEIIEKRIEKLIETQTETETSITETTTSVSEISKKITIDEGETTETKKDIKIIERKKLRQKCAVMFPAVFTSFSKAKSVKQAGMCPCQGSATGVSQISLQVEDPEAADHFVQTLFQKKLIVEANFKMQVQRTSLDANNKIVIEGEKDEMTMTIITSDDKVSQVLTEFESSQLQRKSEAVISPLLTGKREYMKWIQESLNGGANVKMDVAIRMDDEQDLIDSLKV